MSKKKARGTKSSVSAKNMSSVEMLNKNMLDMAAVHEAYVDRVRALPDDGRMPQHAIAIAFLAQRLTAMAQDMSKVFIERATAMRRKGTFEAGDFAVEFQLSPGKRSVAWKDVAAKQAARVAELRGKAFNAKRWAAKQLDQAPQSEDVYKPQIIRAD